MKKIITQNAPAAIGPYSQAIRTGNLIFVSGQLPIDPKTGEMSKGSIGDQTKLIFKSIANILKEEGVGLEKVVKTTVLMKDLDNFSEMNEAYASFFKDVAPARAAFQVAKLPKDSDIEIEAIAEV